MKVLNISILFFVCILITSRSSMSDSFMAKPTTCSKNPKFQEQLLHFLLGSAKRNTGFTFTASNSKEFKLNSCPSLEEQCCTPHAEEFYTTTKVPSLLNHLSGISKAKLTILQFRQRLLDPFVNLLEHSVFRMAQFLKSRGLPLAAYGPALTNYYKALLPGVNITNERAIIKTAVNKLMNNLTVAVWSYVLGPPPELNYAVLRRCFSLGDAVYYTIKSFSAKTMIRELERAFSQWEEVVEYFDFVVHELSTMEEFDISNSCATGLARMDLCAVCAGLQSKSVLPCTGLCLNVVRGCLSPMVRLRQHWTDFTSNLTAFLDHLVNGKNGLSILKALDGSRFQKVVDKGMKDMKKRKKAISEKLYAFCNGLSNIIEENHPTAPFLLKGGPGRHEQSRLRDQTKEVLSELSLLIKQWSLPGPFSDGTLEATCQTGVTNKCWNGQNTEKYARFPSEFTEVGQLRNPEVEIVPADFDKLKESIERTERFRSRLVNLLYQLGAKDPSLFERPNSEEGSGGFGPDDELDESEPSFAPVIRKPDLPYTKTNTTEKPSSAPTRQAPPYSLPITRKPNFSSTISDTTTKPSSAPAQKAAPVSVSSTLEPNLESTTTDTTSKPSKPRSHQSASGKNYGSTKQISAYGLIFLIAICCGLKT